jgi:hypothetical protein
MGLAGVSYLMIESPFSAVKSISDSLLSRLFETLSDWHTGHPHRCWVFDRSRRA